MRKTLLYRLFRSGEIPGDTRSQILKEGVILQDEGIPGSITYRNFRAPGRYSGWKRSWFSGSIVLTRKHFLAFAYSKPVIGVAWSEDKVKQLECTVEDRNRLCIKFNAGTFSQDWSGNMEIRFSTPHAHTFLREIRRKIA